MLPLSVLGQTPADDNKMTAREMFLAARDQAAARPKPKPSVPRSGDSALPTKPKTEVAAAQSKPMPNSGAANIRASYSDTTPLGLRYTILKKSGDRMNEVATNSVFQSGDKIQLEIEVSEPGYLYIVTQGSSGTWEVLFPAAKIDNGDNRVQQGSKVIVPKGHVISFVGTPGSEKLFLIFSRVAEQEIDNMIYSLQGVSGNEPAPKSKTESGPMLMASIKPIDNSMVSRLRDEYSRDLIIEKVNDVKKVDDAKKEDHSVYVVNPKGGADGRVVADIVLDHK